MDFLPGGALRVVDLAQVEDVALHHGAADAAALDDGPGAMLLAVLAARAALEKHAPSVAGERPEGIGWVATARTFEEKKWKIPSKSTRSPRKIGESGVE